MKEKVDIIVDEYLEGFNHGLHSGKKQKKAEVLKIINKLDWVVTYREEWIDHIDLEKSIKELTQKIKNE